MRPSSVRLLPFVALITFSATVSSGPVITSVSTSATLDSKTLVTLSGSNFGNKSQAAPRLLDHVSEVFRGGVLTSPYEAFSEMQEIERASSNNSLIYSNASHSPPRITRNRPARQPGSAHYFHSGVNGFLGDPLLYSNGISSPAGDRTIYVAWHLKLRWDPRYYWSIPLSGASGEFIHNNGESPGEALLVNGQNMGFVVGVSSGWLHAIYPGQTNPNNLRGRQIRGAQSGATVTFPENPSLSNFSGDGYLAPGSNKYIRIRQGSGGDGFRLAWTNYNSTVRGETFSFTSSTGIPPIRAGEWQFFEVAVDLDQGFVQYRVDGTDLGTIQFSTAPENFLDNSGLRLALIGFEGQRQRFQVTEIDSIYVDNTRARVIVADSDRLEDANGFEVQLIESWHNNDISFTLNIGSFQPGQRLYAFVFNEKGEHNSTGFPICDECKAPPGPPSIGKISN